MKKILLHCLILILVLCGCTTVADDPTVPSDTIPVVTAEPTESVAATELPTETSAPAEPPVSLDVEPGAYQEKFYDEIESQYMSYYLFIPENATENMPLVIFLHGDGEVNKIHKLENNALMVNAREIYGDNYPFIAISPCTPMETWNELFVPYTLKHLIENIVDTYKIDPEHIIITGHSRGAVGVWYMINTYGDYFSAAVPISCHCWNHLKMENLTKVPIQAFCGNIEEFECNYLYQMMWQIEEINKAGGNSELTILTARHANTPALAYTEELFEWMLSQ